MGREKHLFGIYRKMRDKSLSFSQVLDIYGFRVIVKDVPTCYLALGTLHGLYKPVPGKFKDYIAIPKGNGYQSLHTTLIGPYGTPVEVQIRTTEMHHVAEAGVASHWLYKDDKSLSELQQRTHKWLQSLLELQSASGDSAEFLEHLKIDLFPDEVYVFTPKGKILPLPRGSTAVDFAYAVHTDIGNRCVACRINHELMPLRTELRNGDQVEIITAAHANPNPAWLSYVKTGKARSQIRHFLKTMQYEESAALGERLLAQALRPSRAAPAGSPMRALGEAACASPAPSRARRCSTDIGLGKRLPADRGAPPGRCTRRGAAGRGATPRGRSSSAAPRAWRCSWRRCCRPIPGDPIVGVIKKGQGLVVHLADCPSIIAARRAASADKWVDVEWAPDSGRLFEVAHPRRARKTAAACWPRSPPRSPRPAPTSSNVTMDEERGIYTALYFTLQVSNRVHLARIMRALRHIPEVVRISRVRE